MKRLLVPAIAALTLFACQSAENKTNTGDSLATDSTKKETAMDDGVIKLSDGKVLKVGTITVKPR